MEKLLEIIVASLLGGLVTGIGAYVVFYTRLVRVENRVEVEDSRISRFLNENLQSNETFKSILSNQNKSILSNQKIEIGTAKMKSGALDEVKKISVEHVVFKTSFSKQPDVKVGISLIDAAVGRERTVRACVEAKDITRDGFNVKFSTWKDSKVYGLYVLYIALGE